MYLRADSVKVDSDEGEFTLEIETVDGERLTIGIHSIDLDAFYDQVKGRIGPYLQEKENVRRLRAGAAAHNLYADHPGFVCSPEDVDESGGYDTSDPKHPRYHSTHADLWDSRAGK